MSEKVVKAIKKLFEQHRVVFWYDSEKELRSEYEELSIAEVEKIEIVNNEFALKYKILQSEPEQKFLLYHEGPQPHNVDNWLLDIHLAEGEFKAGQSAIWLSEMELGPEFATITQDHAVFFNEVNRRNKLKEMLKPDDTEGSIRLKMLSVCTKSDEHLYSILESLISELAHEKDSGFKLIQRCKLDAFLWKQLEREYEYTSEIKSMQDFALLLFKTCYLLAIGNDKADKKLLSNDALAFLKRWKDSRAHYSSFEILSQKYSINLNIEEELQEMNFRQLLEIDYFEIIDLKILNDLIKGVTNKTISPNDCANFVRLRSSSHWYSKYAHIYQAVDCGAQFLKCLAEANLTMGSIDDGMMRYEKSWFQIDQLYRNFIFHLNESRAISLLQKLADQIEGLYTNSYLLPLNNNWQKIIDEIVKWEPYKYKSQLRFYENWVYTYLKDKAKVVVIISDAMRYEIGEELLRLICQEDRYQGSITPVLGVLPSYTQLGMAAHLPHQEISIVNYDTVMIDGKSTQGKENREKVLKQVGRVKVLLADEFMQINRDDARDLFRDHDLIYVYQNIIDKTGDARDSESRVFSAVNDTIDELIKIVKKMTNANATNLIITADHGFIYQNQALVESDFSEVKADGKEIIASKSRMILGKGLKEQSSLKKFTAAQLGLNGDLELQMPKSINRLRLQGAGSRFVHGGASLQEIIVPVLQINKKRQSDTSVVEVDILGSSTTVITAGQLSVTFYQIQAVSDKVQSRTLQAGIYTESKVLISDMHKLTFDFESDSARNREKAVKFVLTRSADAANNQDVYLILEEQIQGTSQFQIYKKARYQLRKSFTSDFDL